MHEFKQLQDKLLAFRDARDWKQFHSPKNLAEGLSIEAAELLENFLWKTTDQSYELTDKEMARVKAFYADRYGQKSPEAPDGPAEAAEEKVPEAAEEKAPEAAEEKASEAAAPSEKSAPEATP